MTLKNKIAAITAASMVAFVGIGFAAWTFNEGQAKEAEESAYATSAINGKDVVLSGNTEVYLVLDQDHPYWSLAVDTGAKPVELTNGKITVTPDYEVTDQNDGAIWTWTLTSQMEVDSAIATYVSVTGFDQNDHTGEIAAEDGEDAITGVDYALPALAYTASKPSNYTEYQAMLSAIETAHITFTFNCIFAEKIA